MQALPSGNRAVTRQAMNKHSEMRGGETPP
jgi:hypothetical protein